MTDNEGNDKGIDGAGPPSAAAVPTLTHEHTYASRMAIVGKLELSQRFEHEALVKVRNASERNTSQILEVLTGWLSEEYAFAPADDVAEIASLSDISQEQWMTYATKRNSAEFALKAAETELQQAESHYKALDPSVWKQLQGTEQEKKNIKEAKALIEQCKNRVKSAQLALDQLDAEIKEVGRVFLSTCCANLHKITTTSSIGRRLHNLAREAKNEIAREWEEHCKKQQDELAVIERHLAILKRVYQLEGSLS
jgi:hypothetical protein